MKNYFSAIYTVIIAAVASFTFSSCNSDDEPVNTDGYATFQNALAVSPEVVKYFEIKAVYTDPAGKTTTVEMPVEPKVMNNRMMCVLDLSTTSAVLPAGVSVSYSIERKTDVAVETEKVDLYSTYVTKVVVYDKKGKEIATNGQSQRFGALDTSADEVDSYLTQFRSIVKDIDMKVSSTGGIYLITENR